MRPQSLNFTVSPLKSPAAVNRRILGEIQNSPIQTSSPLKVNTSKPYERPTSNCYNLSSFSDRAMFRKGSKLSRVFEDRSNFRRASEEKENLPMSDTMVNLEVDEETRDVVDNVECTMTRNALTSWCMAKLDVSDPTPLSRSLCDDEMAQAVPGEAELDDADMEALHDLEEELQPDNFNVCNNYEIVSTDSPDIISRGRSTTSKISGKNLQFGAPLLDHETSTSFNRSSLTGRTLNFDDSFEFTPPAHKTATPAKQCTVKKSLKFTDSPIIVRENSESSIGTMSSPSSTIKSCLSESSNSHESGFMSEMEEQYFEAEDSTSPPRVRNFKELISGPIRDRRISFNRSHSLQQPGKSDLFAIEEDVRRSQKRPDEELVVGPSKRRKSSCSSPQSFKKPTEPSRPVLHRAYSENNASIMSALARSAAEPDLIGDFSLPCALPLTGGAHADLRSISCHTLAALLRGDYRGLVQRYTVIDCRYPYEYEGGHIAGAVNLYTPAQILDLVERPPAPAAPTAPDAPAAPDAPPRSVLVFHCEFSRERGPKLSRFLRSSDRAKNKENYPYLHYPEIYLLHEGYKKFYSIYPGLCTPEGYTAMLDSRHRDDFKLHRSNSLSSTTKPPRTQKKERRSRLML